MNEAQRKVRARVAFTVAVLCLALLLAGFRDLLSRSIISIVLALGFYLRAGRKKKE